MEDIFWIIYTKLFDFAKLTSKDGLYHYTAMYLFSLLIAFNLQAVRLYRYYFLGYYRLDPPLSGTLIMLFTTAVTVYFITVYKGRYVIHYERIKEMEKVRGRSYAIYAICFTLSTFGFLISAVIVGHHLLKGS